jgi:integrase
MPGFKNGLRRVGDIYHYCFRVHGKQFKGSTRARDLPTAKKAVEGLRQQAILGKPLVSQSITFEALVQKWMTAHRASASPKHLQSVEVMTRVWLMEHWGRLPINKITTYEVMERRTAMLDAGKAEASVNHLLRVIKLLLNFAVQCGDLDCRKAQIKQLRIQQKPRPTLPAHRVQEFLKTVDQVARGHHAPLMIRVMLGMGLRESEVLGMRWAWFNKEDRSYKICKTKGKEIRTIPVPEWLWNAIDQMPKPTLSQLVFPGEDGKPHQPHYCRKVLNAVAKQMDLGRLTQHRLRATFASLHAEAGTPLPEIQGMLGHKDISTTMIYVEQSLESKRKAQDMLSQKLGLA